MLGYVTGTEEIVTKQDKILKILKGVYNEVGVSSPPLATKLKITEQECSMVRNHRIENIKRCL